MRRKPRAFSGGEFDDQVHARARCSPSAAAPGSSTRPSRCSRSRRLSRFATPAMSCSALLGLCAVHLPGGIAKLTNVDGARSSYFACHRVLSFGCGSKRSVRCAIPSTSCSRVAKPVVFVLLALPVGGGQPITLSAKRAQLFDIEEVDSAFCPLACRGDRRKRVWTSIHSLNILAASSRGS